MSKVKLGLIAALDINFGIGKNNKLPWFLPEDLRFFSDLTRNNTVIMGRKTWESIPEHKKPLKDRINIIISKTCKKIEGCLVFKDLHTAVKYAKDIQRDIFFIGGHQIYKEALEKFEIDNVYITHIAKNFSCDTLFPIDKMKNFCIKYFSEKKISKQNFIPYRFICYSMSFDNGIYNEDNYLNSLREILDYGEDKNDRTKVGVKSKFFETMTFDISNSFPLLTTKKMPFKTILRELLWFLSGSTNNKDLVEKGVKIWNGNTSREFLDSRGLLDLPEGDIGEGYGHLFRHLGAEYINCNEPKTGGFDQIKYVIDLIKNDPTSRRIVLSLWRPDRMHRMALPACHATALQFYIRDNKFLDCNMYQRSADYFLGIPFNIASYALLVSMISHITGYISGKLNIITGDSHIYKNHIDQVKQQLKRQSIVQPQLIIKNKRNDINEFTEDDFELVGYFSYDTIKGKMAI